MSDLPVSRGTTHGELMQMHVAAESDPNGVDQHAPGAKLDSGKPEMALLLDFNMALTAVSMVATYGAKKYSRGGWKEVQDGQYRYTSAMLRHLLAEQRETCDKDTNITHAAHVAWNALARLEFMLRE